MDCHDQNYLALPGGPCGYKAKSESEETKSLVWLTKCFGAGCGKSLARVLLKEAVVVLGCRFCVPRAVNTVFKAKKSFGESLGLKVSLTRLAGIGRQGSTGHVAERGTESK